MLAKLQLQLEKEVVDAIIDKLINTPSGDNSQHWRYKWTGYQLHIIHDLNRARHPLNDGHYSSLLSLGCLIEALYICTSDFGIEPQIDYELSDFNNKALAKVSFTEKKRSINILSKWIEKRETNRNIFDPDPLPKNYLDDIQSEFSKLGIRVESIEKPSKAFYDYLVKSELYVWVNRLVFLNTTKWIRYNKKEEEKTRDGFNLKNINLNKVDALFIKLFIRFPLVQKILYKLVVQFKAKADAQKTIENTANFISFSSKISSPLSIVNAGRAGYKTWLKLNSDSYGVQPMTAPGQLPFVLKNRGQLIGSNSAYRDFFTLGESILKNEFNLKSEEVFWMLRTGKANTLKEDARTLRIYRDQLIDKD